jgi:cytoskeletal protein RodZ
LIQLGAFIRSRREEKGFSLKEVENATSIRHAYLQAIEEGHLGKLISPIYAHGFISKYAVFLDLDPEQLLSDHPYVMKILTERQPETQEFTLGIGTLEVRGTPGGEVKWLPNVIWVVVSVAAILVGWFLGRYFGLF